MNNRSREGNPFWRYLRHHRKHALSTGKEGAVATDPNADCAKCGAAACRGVELLHVCRDCIQPIQPDAHFAIRTMVNLCENGYSEQAAKAGRAYLAALTTDEPTPSPEDE